MQLPNVLVPSRFVSDYHCAVTNEAGSLELSLLRPKATVSVNGARVGCGTAEEGPLQLRHGDVLCLVPGSAIMFFVVHNEELVVRLRSGELRPEDLRALPQSARECNEMAQYAEAVGIIFAFVE
jgi:hypothetical protein